MTPEENIALIKRHAPIFWLHADEAFLPEDCRIMEHAARIGTGDDDGAHFRLSELDRYSKDHSMDIPGIDFRNFGDGADYDGPEMGPERVSAFVRKSFSNNPFLYPEAGANLSVPGGREPAYYGNVREMLIPDIRGEALSRDIRRIDPGVFGSYTVIQYRFFYLFNDSWNLHIGDWDSSLEVFIKNSPEGGSRSFLRFHIHNIAWLTQFVRQPQNLTAWISQWADSEGRRMGTVYQIAGHPFVFIAKGAHGAYPTPGYSIHGCRVGGFKMICQSDYPQIGKLCLLPDNEALDENSVKSALSDAGVGVDKMQVLIWKEPEMIEDQAWLRYKGLWGSKSDCQGWGGPKGPTQKGNSGANAAVFKDGFLKASSGDYEPLTIIKNWHGWK